VDVHVVDDVRNFLFGPPGAGGFDLPSLNIQRGRDHGLPPYNELRLELGLDPLDFHQITSDPVLRHRLEVVYGDASRIDAWVGGLAEDHVDGALVGELVRTILVDQFERLRAGDRFWYEHALSGRERRSLEKTTLADVIRRNTRIDEEIQDDVFHLPVIRCLGDANFDGVVSARDLRVVVRNLGQPGGRGDVNQTDAARSDGARSSQARTCRVPYGQVPHHASTPSRSVTFTSPSPFVSAATQSGSTGSSIVQPNGSSSAISWTDFGT
jgi:hypothetical protein